MRQGEFLSMAMTPRAWRMIFYCCFGFLIYGGIVLAELLQEVKLARLEVQAKMAERLGQTPTLPVAEGEEQQLKVKNDLP